jgi:serine/threonine-protein kinase SRPK3
MDDNILYDSDTDRLYVLIYKLGEGACASVWFSLEFMNFVKKIKSKKVNIAYRALKIHTDDCYDEGMLDTTINKLLYKDGKYCDHINYPLSHFVIDEMVIVVYEVAIGSLYDVLKIFNKKLDVEFVAKIVPQLTDAVSYVHECGYIHSDIKPENFLLMGYNKMQKNIIDFTQKYDFYNNLKDVCSKKTSDIDGILDVIHEPIYTFIKELSKKFNIRNNILSDDVSDISIESTSECDSESETKSVDTECESYTSHTDEYPKDYDKFHINEILASKLNNTNNSSNNNPTDLLDMKYITNPIVKLTDFGLFEKIGSAKHTIQTRYYRAPEILLGIEYNEKSDVWALGCTIYEILVGKMFIDIDDNVNINKIDKDLVNIYMLIEKIGKKFHYDINNIIKTSPRRKYLVNSNNTLKFYKKIVYKSWIDDLHHEYDIKSNFFYTEVIKKIVCMLHACPNNRQLYEL